jgi:hypothetical protein
MPNKNQESVNELRAQRAKLQQKIETVKEARAAEHKGIAIAVAENAEASSDLMDLSSAFDKEVEALTLGVGGFDERIRIAIGAANLQAAKLGVRRDKIENDINVLKEQRKILVFEALTILRSGADTPHGFTRKVDAMDDEISTKTDELASLRASVAAVSVV